MLQVTTRSETAWVAGITIRRYRRFPVVNRDEMTPAHHPRVAARVYSGEAVILSPAENMVRMLNPVGSRIWELVDGTRTVDEIAMVLTTEYEVTYPQAVQSTEEFVETLVTKGLLAWT